LNKGLARAWLRCTVVKKLRIETLAKVWHGATENCSLNDGQTQTFASHVYM
jgi:hypothetical protein